MRLIEFEYAQPIERMRGGSICVAICASYEQDNSGDLIVVSGFALTPLDTEEAILEAQARALARCEAEAQKLAAQAPVKAAESRAMNVIMEAKGQEIAAKVPETKYKELMQPARDTHQQIINQLCETIGIESIQLLGEVPYTIAAFAALQNELTKISTKLTKIGA